MKGYVEKDFFNSLSESLNCIKSDEVSVDDTPILKVLVASPSSSSSLSISSVDVNEVMKDYYVDADLSKKGKRKRNNKASRKLRAAKKKKHEDMQKACETLGNEQVALKQTIEKMNIEQKCTLDTVKLTLRLLLHQNRMLFKSNLLKIADAKDKCKDEELQPFYDHILSIFQKTMEDNLSSDDYQQLVEDLFKEAGC